MKKFKKIVIGIVSAYIALVLLTHGLSWVLAQYKKFSIRSDIESSIEAINSNAPIRVSHNTILTGAFLNKYTVKYRIKVEGLDPTFLKSKKFREYQLVNSTFTVCSKQNIRETFLQNDYDIQYWFISSEDEVLSYYTITKADCENIDNSDADTLSENYVRATRKALPLKTASNESLIAINGGKKRIEFITQLNHIKKNEIDHFSFSKELSESIPKSHCSAAEAFIFLAKGLELIYVLVDKKGEPITSIPINEEICQGLTFNLDKIKKQIK